VPVSAIQPSRSILSEAVDNSKMQQVNLKKEKGHPPFGG
jgi:hypothetical protein